MNKILAYIGLFFSSFIGLFIAMSVFYTWFFPLEEVYTLFSLIMVPIIMLLIAYGFYRLSKYFHKKIKNKKVAKGIVIASIVLVILELIRNLVVG